MAQKQLRIGIVGVGNCASSLVQGLEFYKDAASNMPVPGLMNVEVGGYHVGDVVPVAAFDVSSAKVGRDLADALLAAPNNTARFAAVKPTGVRVERGPTLDGLGRYNRDIVSESDEVPADVTAVLRETRVDVLVCYLPVGSQAAAEFYAERALEAGCAFVNCMPVFIASNPQWERRFAEAGLPIIGDDIKSQVGATIVHRTLVNLLRDRGIRLDRTYQLNFGGNSDFQNMLERDRLESKKISKTQAGVEPVRRAARRRRHPCRPERLRALVTDRKWAHIRLEGTGFGDVPLSIELKLEVWDSPNSAGVVIDAVRCAKVGLGPRHRRRADRPVELLHEVPAAPVHRRRGAPPHRTLHGGARVTPPPC